MASAGPCGFAEAADVPFGSQQIIIGRSTTTRSPESVFAADVDGDGDIDVLSASSNDAKIAWYENLLRDGCVRPGFDCDGDVDLADLLVFDSCFTTPDKAPLAGCRLPALDRDGDVDLADLLAFQAAYTGAR